MAARCIAPVVQNKSKCVDMLVLSFHQRQEGGAVVTTVTVETVFVKSQ